MTVSMFGSPAAQSSRRLAIVASPIPRSRMLRRVATGSRRQDTKRRRARMSIESNGFADDGAATYLRGGDPALAEYFPAWINDLAEDVTLEGSAMNGAIQGADAVRTVLLYIRSLYEQQEFNCAGPYGENAFLEDYTARVRGEPLGNVVQVTRNTAGRAQHVVANYRPLRTLLLVSHL